MSKVMSNARLFGTLVSFLFAVMGVFVFVFGIKLMIPLVWISGMLIVAISLAAVIFSVL